MSDRKSNDDVSAMADNLPLAELVVDMDGKGSGEASANFGAVSDVKKAGESTGEANTHPIEGSTNDVQKSSSADNYLSEPIRIPVHDLEYTKRAISPDELRSLAASIRVCQIHDILIGPRKENGKHGVIAGNCRTAAADLDGITHLRARIYSGPHSDALSVAENVLRKAERPDELLKRVREMFKNGADKKQMRQILGMVSTVGKSSIHYLVWGAQLKEAAYQMVLASKNVLGAIRKLKEQGLAGKHGKGGADAASHSLVRDPEPTLGNADVIFGNDAESTCTDEVSRTTAKAAKGASRKRIEWVVAEQVQIPLADMALGSDQTFPIPWVLILARSGSSSDGPIDPKLVRQAAETLARRMQ